jgi:steroid delta-isomerase-like uncharacterized protein
LTADELFDRWQAAWSGRDVRLFESLCTPSFHYEDPLTPEPLQGLRALAGHAQRLWDAFPDIRLERSGERLASASFAVAPVRVLGTQAYALDALPATGKPLDFQAVFFCELDDGLLRRARAFFDVYDVGVQLGVLPARGSLSAKALLALRGYGLRSRAEPDG